jgi:hypothetical protein
MEIWKAAIYNGEVYEDYEVSNYGRVRSLRSTMKLLSPSKNNCGYLYVNLRKNGRQKLCLIHRLVGCTFMGTQDNMEINHIDECKTNNHVDNLEWCTRKENVNHGTRNDRASKAQKGKVFSEEHKCKLRENHADMSGGKHPQAKKVVCVETGQVFDAVKEAEEWAGVTGGISACCKGKIKTAGKHSITGEKLHWMYYDEWLALAN